MPRLGPLLLACALLVAAARAPVCAEDRPVSIGTIADPATYSAYAEIIDADEWGKFVIDIKAQRMYYFDVKQFPLHRDFVFQVLLNQPQTRAAINDYNKNYAREKPQYILGYLAHHLKNNRWDFSYWAGDHIDAEGVRVTRNWLLKTFFVKDKDLYFRPESLLQERLLPQLKDIATITNDQMYKQVDYQAFSTGRAVGKLRIVPPTAALDDLNIQSDEIVILQESYPDITPVAGIVTSTFSTPLSHVNLRARAWRIPNAGYKDAGTRFASLAGKQVLLEVREASFTLRQATAQEMTGWRRKQTMSVQIPRPDFSVTELRPLDGMQRKDAGIYGAKAANLGEIVSSHLPGVDVPAGFGIPFAAYRDHLKRHGIDVELEALLVDARFGKDPLFRRQRLTALQQRIRTAELDGALRDTIYEKIQKQLGGQSVFVRSSTNAEDLPNFNGAGLYYTAANVKGKDQLADAMREVWASLWSFRAVEERMLYRIDERAVACALLIVVSLPATAAGVLVTRHLYDPSNDHAYTVNAQRGLGLRVVDGKTTPEQVVFNIRYPATRLVSRSADSTMLVLDEAGGIKEVPVTNHDVILTDARTRALVEKVQKIRALFPYDLDVEWALEGERFWILQVRAFVGGDMFRPLPFAK